MSMLHDITVVIRSTGERTKDLCYQLLCKQVPPANVIVINEYPFRRAAQRSFEIGIELGRPWTLCLDADILLRRNAVHILRNWTLAAPNNVLYVQGTIFDKIFGRPRRAGPYFHRTSLLPKLLEYMPAEGMSLRPDTDAAMQLGALGYPRLQQNLIIAVHDFEQYYRDIYRKAFVHAHKHVDHMSELEPLWQRLAGQDQDYQVALWGLRDGRLFQGPVSHDVRRFPQDANNLLGTRGWKEKTELDFTAFDHFDVDRLMIEYGQMRCLAESKERTEVLRPDYPQAS